MSNGQEIDIEFKPINYTQLKRLLKFLKPYTFLVVIASIITLLSSALGPLLPYLTKVGIDNYIAKNDIPGLFKIAFLILIVLLLNAGLRFVLTYIMQKVGQSVLLDIRTKVFEHVSKLSLRFYDKHPVGKLVTRVTNDVEVLNELFSSGVVMIIADLLLIGWIIGFMFYTNVELAALTLCILPFLILATSVFRKKVRIIFRDIRQKVSGMNSFLNEFITGIKVVKLFTQEKNQKEKFDSVNLAHTDLWLKTIFYYAIFFPVMDMLSTIALAIIIWYSAGNVLSGLMTVGTLIAFTQYAEMFFRPIRDLTEKYTTLQSAMASAERIFAILDTDEFIEEPVVALSIGELAKSIEFRNVSFSYDNEKWVLNDVSFIANKGETVAIVGATGAGKTSIINLLCRFYDYQSGEILFDGKSIKLINAEDLRSKIALVMQDVFLFARTIGENISLGLETIDNAKINEAALALGAYDFIHKLPNGINSDVMEGGTTLSSGQRQLLSFCRAYAKNPEILILDEATSNIDSETEQIIEKSLSKLLEGRTSIIIAHRLSTIKRADKIIVLHKGKVREEGTHKELLALNGIYARLYKLQYKDELAA
ncbi:MAG: ABC transporter ATP-binding protein [Bacteroidota bacterium]